MPRPKFNNGLVRLYHADARELPLKDGTVHCCVTSPPYLGLRQYQTDDERVLGLESSVGEYIANLIDVFREVWRVLRDDGVLWINMGDSYTGSGKGQNGDGTHAAKHGEKQHTSKGTLTGGLPTNFNHALEGNRVDELAGGNVLGVPWRLAMALQADGWILRDSIIWAKTSPMPESLAGWRWERCRVKVGRVATDWGVRPKGWEAGLGSHDTIPDGNYRQNGERGSTVAEYTPCPGCAKCSDNDGLVLRKGSWRCTSSYEHIFMLVKSMGYWADGEAVKTASLSDHPSGNGFKRDARMTYQNDDGSARGKDDQWQMTAQANRRNVWRDIHAEPYSGEHYATFPPDLPRICIQASTSEMGCCPKCGGQITRIVDRESASPASFKNSNFTEGKTGVNGLGRVSEAQRLGEPNTFGWRPCCGHTEALTDPIPALVLDPFMGTGTTGLAAMRLNRRCVGTDLSEEYIKQVRARLSEQALPLPLVGQGEITSVGSAT